jgi:NADPH:quinone reductase-like Zn-dependent oxidoreductase
MRAAVYTRYGAPEDVLQVTEAENPVPQDDEVLVKVHASSLNKADLIMLRGRPAVIRLAGFGLFRPKFRILGTDVAGRVEAVGGKVQRFKAGDEVFGNLFGSGRGAYAEYACAKEDALALKPSNVTFEQAAAVPLAAGTALMGLRDKGNIQPGQKVLVNGASGGVGTFAVQIAKALGAEVTAVCSTKHVETARSIGADHVIDYTQEDFTENGQHYDPIMGANGYRPIMRYMNSLSPHGTYVMTGGKGTQLSQALLMGPLISRSKGKRVVTGNLKLDNKGLVFLGELLRDGKLAPVIDRLYPLSRISEAFRYLGEGHAGGKVVITIDEGTGRAGSKAA